MDFLQDSVFFAVVLTLITYLIGLGLKKRFRLAIFNPLLVSAALMIVVMILFRIDYSVYEAGAKYINFFLTPSTVALAVPLYEQLEPLKKNWPAILLGILAGALTSAVCVLVLAVMFGFTHEQYVTLLPKSVTTAIGMGVSQELGGIVPITVAVIAITGVLGNMMADFLCRLFKITDPIAKGIGIGSSAHAMGTARAMEIGEVEGAMSSLSIVVSGVITVFIAALFAKFY